MKAMGFTMFVTRVLIERLQISYIVQLQNFDDGNYLEFGFVLEGYIQTGR